MVMTGPQSERANDRVHQRLVGPRGLPLLQSGLLHDPIDDLASRAHLRSERAQGSDANNGVLAET
jgi:hypothetical protein